MPSGPHLGAGGTKAGIPGWIKKMVLTWVRAGRPRSFPSPSDRIRKWQTVYENGLFSFPRGRDEMLDWLLRLCTCPSQLQFYLTPV